MKVIDDRQTLITEKKQSLVQEITNLVVRWELKPKTAQDYSTVFVLQINKYNKRSREAAGGTSE